MTAKQTECVYFLRCGEYIKIGKSRSSHTLQERISTLQTGNPYPLILLGLKAGGLKEEKKIHDRFRHLHHRGEWFKYNEDIEKFILLGE